MTALAAALLPAAATPVATALALVAACSSPADDAPDPATQESADAVAEPASVPSQSTGAKTLTLEGLAGLTLGQPVPEGVHFPSIAEGVEGVAFVDACVRSSRRNSAWVQV